MLDHIDSSVTLILLAPLENDKEIKNDKKKDEPLEEVCYVKIKSFRYIERKE